MATNERNTGLPGFFTDTNSEENVRRQFIEAPLEAASQPALGAALELANLLSILPDAFVASQQRELKRVVQSSSKDDPRAVALQTSIEQAEVLKTTTRLGQARAERALVALASKDKVFHGFVSNQDLVPQQGLTVRLTGGKATRGALSATTDADGYFSIKLGTTIDPRQAPPAPAATRISLSKRLDDLLARLGQEQPRTAPPNPDAIVSEVEILKRGKLLHSDPVPVTLESGSVYREYVIADSGSAPSSDYRDYVAKQAAKSQESVGDPAAGKVGPTSETLLSSATPAAKPRAKKSSKASAKSKKTATKK